ncbi:AzlC family ABC transporter permease [Pseudooceanicola sp.]|uniref:AzlC family ABC transporter permease n=1 Tax=Pseudooceanicola sp. TaxID=1914328 RepID=UPI002622F95F|nr:AzlC family ABC transporter permease [Pseudooceanicola sp.]MDF1855329.1 AzlC family ABC transporter permease [Pseudooceanicola sp.]
MTTTVKSTYWQGVRDGAPFFLVVSPFALLFGVVATEAGLNVFEALVFSVAVIAGAAQLTALQLLQTDAPVMIALISALAVNLRMAMYSASLTPYLGAAPFWKRGLVAYFTVDQSFACSMIAFEKNPGWSLSQRLAYFFGVVTPICPFWYVFTVVGALIGEAIPPALGLDFAMPITFIAMIAPMLRSLPHLAACLVAVTLALLLVWLPLNLGLLLAGIGGMMAGAATEVWRDRHMTAPLGHTGAEL